jgi:hypothetical protein
MARPPKLSNDRQREARADLERGVTPAELAIRYGCSQRTIERLRAKPSTRDFAADDRMLDRLAQVVPFDDPDAEIELPSTSALLQEARAIGDEAESREAFAVAARAARDEAELSAVRRAELAHESEQASALRVTPEEVIAGLEALQARYAPVAARVLHCVGCGLELDQTLPHDFLESSIVYLRSLSTPTADDAGELVQRTKQQAGKSLERARTRRKVGDLKTAQRAVRDGAKFASIASAITRKTTDGAAFVIPRHEIEEGMATVQERVSAILERPLHCAECSRALSVEWGDGSRGGAQK